MNNASARAVWVITAAVILALGAAVAWSASSLADAKQAAEDAAADTAACRQLAGQLTVARRSPTGDGPVDEDIGPRLERAMAAAEIDGVSLTRVAPQPPRMIGQTGVARRATQVVLERVSLKQALSFVGSLVGRGVTLDTFELTVPVAEGGTPPQPGDDEWHVELAVSQTVRLKGER